MKIVAIIQARMGSRRLPGKVMREILGKPLIGQMLDRLKRSEKIGETVIAIPASPENDPIAEWARKAGCPLERGDENNVLDRFHQAAVKTGADIVVRLTADCPLIDPRITDRTIQAHLEAGADYTTNGIPDTFPRGLDTEVIRREAFEEAYRNSRRDYELEHVTPYLYEHPERFKLRRVEAEGRERRPDLRLTVDTEEDLALVREIFRGLGAGGRMFYYGEIVEFLDRHPELAALNARVRQKELGE